jgi:hypothetical protein
MSWNIARFGLPVTLAVSSLALVTPSVSLLVRPDAPVSHSLESRAGVVGSVNARLHRFSMTSEHKEYTVTYKSTTVWSAGLEKVLKAGWHIVVKGEFAGSRVTAAKIVNNPMPERLACKADAETVATAVAAYEANSGATPSTVASLTTKAHGGPYLKSIPGGMFYRFALNWGGNPGRENGGKNPGLLYVAPVWIEVVRTYVAFESEGSHQGCNAAT